jgi:hypothetical protein
VLCIRGETSLLFCIGIGAKFRGFLLATSYFMLCPLVIRCTVLLSSRAHCFVSYSQVVLSGCCQTLSFPRNEIRLRHVSLIYHAMAAPLPIRGEGLVPTAATRNLITIIFHQTKNKRIQSVDTEYCSKTFAILDVWSDRWH